MQDSMFIGLDVHKATISVAVAQGKRGGEVRHWGSVPHRPDHIRKLVEKLAAGGARLHFCYEAGPCGYGLHRQLVEMGRECIVVAPSLIPVKAGDRVKTDRRDAVMLAKLHRAGELTAVWVPDAAHEAMRDLVRARATAMRVTGKARQHLQGFLLRHGRIYPGRKGWTGAYRRWLAMVRFKHPAQQIVLQDYIDAVADAEARVGRLTGQIADLLPNWNLAPVVDAVQAMRGVGFIVAVTVVAERLHADDTTVPLLAKGKTQTARLWTYVRDDRPFGGPAPPAGLFHFSRDRRGEHPQKHLARWRGILQADACAGFNALFGAVRNAFATSRPFSSGA